MIEIRKYVGPSQNVQMKVEQQGPILYTWWTTLIFKILFYFKVCVCTQVHTHVHMSTGAYEGIRSLGVGVLGSYELPK